MKPATGEPPSPGTQTSPALPVALSHPSDTPQKPWRPANVWASFSHAGDGVRETFRAERNFRVHCILTIFVVVAAVCLHLSPLRVAALVLAAAFVLFAELFNTAVEATVDLAMPERHPLAKRAKDAAAGAVLVAACAAVVVGAFVFLPVITPLLPRIAAPSLIALGVVFVVAFTVWLARRRSLSPEIVPGTSTELSRKWVIGVMLAAFVAASAYQLQGAFWERSGGHIILQPLHESSALPSSAGVC